MKPQLREHLAGHAVVWIAHVSEARGSLSFLEPYLDAHDRERAARFHFADDRARFVLGRGLLRKCLGYHLMQNPEMIELAYTDLGRPIFPSNHEIQFSISHTHDLVAIALTCGAQIGIDLEFVQPDLAPLELAERIFSADDLRAFQALPADEQSAAFYRAWTRKEAYLKARGEGIAEGLRQISVSLGDEKSVPLMDSRDKTGSQKWRLIALPLPMGYTGNLACDDPGKRVDGAFIHLRNDASVTDVSSHFS